MRRLALLSLLTVFPAAAARSADEVRLKNGDRLTGTIKSLSGGKLVLATEHSGTVSVDWAQVASVVTEGKVKVKMSTGEVLEGNLVAAPEGRLKIATEGAAGPVEIELGKVKNFNEPPTQWHGNLSAAGRTTDGNTHNRSFLVTGEGTRATENDLFLLRAIFRYGDKDKEIQERSSYGLAKYNYTFYAGLYGFASVELNADRFRDLDLRTVVSAGLGYDVFKESWIDLSAEVGAAYFDNNFHEAEDESHMGARGSARLRMALPLDFEFRDLFTIYPNFEDSPDWQCRNEATLGTALGGGWSLLGGMITDYDHEPAPGLRKHDNTYFVGLGYTF